MCIFKVRTSVFLFLISTSFLNVDLISTSDICADQVDLQAFQKQENQIYP